MSNVQMIMIIALVCLIIAYVFIRKSSSKKNTEYKGNEYRNYVKEEETYGDEIRIKERASSSKPEVEEEIDMEEQIISSEPFIEGKVEIEEEIIVDDIIIEEEILETKLEKEEEIIVEDIIIKEEIPETKLEKEEAILNMEELELEERILEEIRKQNGILQTKFYKSFDPKELTKLRKALKELDDSGKIIREKEGNSYKLSIK